MFPSYRNQSNQLAGFYMMGTLFVKGLSRSTGFALSVFSCFHLTICTYFLVALYLVAFFLEISQLVFFFNCLRFLILYTWLLLVIFLNNIYYFFIPKLNKLMISYTVALTCRAKSEQKNASRQLK